MWPSGGYAASKLNMRMNLRAIFLLRDREAVNISRCFRAAPFLLGMGLLALLGLPLRAQESTPGPLTPPPPDHNVRRIENQPVPEAPPSLPAEEIIRRFAQKEDLFLEARTHFSYRKSVRLAEFDADGKALGEFNMTTEPAVSDDGRLYNKAVGRPTSTLKVLHVQPEDFESLAKFPAFPLLTSQLAKYDVKYAGKEQVDEISCYIFQVKPKGVDRAHAYFDGVIWVDEKFLEIVKTYGKWVSELGDMHSEELPFTLFETYRENVGGRYWFPSYSRSDDTVHLKDSDVSIRLTIKWSGFKPVPAPNPGDPMPRPTATTPTATVKP
jgi:hypothetical protein